MGVAEKLLASSKSQTCEYFMNVIAQNSGHN